MEELRNSKCVITYNANYKYKTDVFGGRDLEDVYNEPAFYNTTMRSHKKAWKALKESFTETTTLEQAMQVLRDNGIRTHYWCMMD